MLLPLSVYPDPVLSQKAREIHPEEIATPQFQKRIVDMAETMYARDGIGLAAPQVGISERMFVMDVEGGLFVFVNPVIMKTTGTQSAREGCLSFPGVYGHVERALTVMVRGLDQDGVEFEDWYSGFPARVIQHETEHLDGKLFFTRFSTVDRMFTEGTLKHLRRSYSDR